MLALVVPEVCFYATVTSATYVSACQKKNPLVSFRRDYVDAVVHERLRGA